ncbi:MAG: ATP-dependent DNA ligase, partial [Methanomicrobiales archaeon]|nr:ATP-dependent DNA ligase [Methanomicrobiales archaeon]
VAYVTGHKKEDVVEAINRTGDAGAAVEELLAGKEQMTFSVQQLDISDVYRELERIATGEGKGSQREKLLAARRLFGNTSPKEGRYLARLMMGELRIGIGEGNVRDAIAKAFSLDTALIEHAHQALNDLGEVAMRAKKGVTALQDVHIEIFRPVKMMLAQQGTIDEMVQEYGDVAVEYKYDGTRFQLHRKGATIRVYSRKLEDVTAALPDVITTLGKVTDHDVILDGEVVAMKDGKPRPFQFVLQRFRRKYEVSSFVEKIELIPFVFDILYLDGKTLIDLPLSERRKILEETLTGAIAPQFRSGDLSALEKVYAAALDAGHEGVMVKEPGSRYLPGVRGKHWVKVKPEVDTLDLAVIGAEWGEGRRAHLFGSFLLACQDNGRLLPIGKVATGFSDEVLAETFEILKDTVISRSGKEVQLEPSVVFEVGYSEIQKSPNYESGYALRFPRFIRIRSDKGIEEIETLEGIRSRIQQKFGSG